MQFRLVILLSAAASLLIALTGPQQGDRFPFISSSSKKSKVPGPGNTPPSLDLLPGAKTEAVQDALERALTHEDSSAREAVWNQESRSLMAAFRAARHEIRPLSPHQSKLPRNHGVRLFATNPGQQITARFLDHSVRFSSGWGDDPWTGELSLQREGGSSSSVHAEGQRATFLHPDGITEWYNNLPEGFEHGFTLAARTNRTGLRILNMTLKGLLASAMPNRPAGSFDLQFSTPDGVPVLAYTDLKVWDAAGRDLDARMDPTGQGLQITIPDAHAIYPITVDPLIYGLEQQLSPGPLGAGSNGDQLGSAVAIEGDRILLGSLHEDTISSNDSGCVYEFTRSGGTWSLAGKIEPSDGAPYDKFGGSICLDGNLALIGAVDGGRTTGSNAGAAYVFTHDGSTWQETQKLTQSDPQGLDDFSNSVALSGSVAVIGSYKKNSSRGVVYVFEASGGHWSETQILTASDNGPGDQFGIQVATNGTWICVTADDWDGPTINALGAAYVFGKPGDSWTEEAVLTASDGAFADKFGSSVAIDGGTILIGVTDVDASPALDSGACYVFVHESSTWSEQAKLVPSDPEPLLKMGQSVALEGDTAVLGAHTSAYVFVRTETTWSEEQKLSALGSTPEDALGNAVGISGSTIVVGAPGTAADTANAAGSAVVFDHHGGNWSETIRLDVGNSRDYDRFGGAVALEGDRIAVGSATEFTASGDEAGAVYVFHRSGDTWSLESRLEPDDAAAWDKFGISLALSGNTLLAGSVRADLDGHEDAGAAYEFTRSSGAWIQTQKLVSSDHAAKDFFGSALAISGDLAVIGAPGDDSNTGAAYIFSRSGPSWSEDDKLLATYPWPASFFGEAVAIDGTTVLIGEPGRNQGGSNYAGAAYVFRLDDGSWSGQGSFSQPPSTGNHDFGRNVALDGDTAVVTSPADSSMVVFVRSQASWSFQQEIGPGEVPGSGGVVGGVFIRDDEILAGCSAGGASADGQACMFKRSGTTWSHLSTVFAPYSGDPGGFGTALAFEGDTVVVGAPDLFGTDSFGAEARYQGGTFVFTGIPDILVTRSTGSEMVSGVHAAGFGTWVLDEYADPRTIIIINNGTTDLHVSGITVTGAGSSHFETDLSGTVLSLAPAETTTMDILFRPLSSGYTTAQVEIASNDPDESPFLIPLYGTGASARELFDDEMADEGYFGVDADPSTVHFPDGLSNLTKYAFNLQLDERDAREFDPALLRGLPRFRIIEVDGVKYSQFEYSRRKNSGLIYTPMKAADSSLSSFVPMTGEVIEGGFGGPAGRGYTYIRNPYDPTRDLSCFGYVRVELP